MGKTNTSPYFNGCLGSVFVGRLNGQWHLIMGHYACHEASIADTVDTTLVAGHPDKGPAGNKGAATNKIPELWQEYQHLFHKDRQSFLYRPEKTNHEDMVSRLNEIMNGTTGLSAEEKNYTEETAEEGNAAISVKVNYLNRIKIKFAK
ncbi:unnamed protein product [Clonostachys rosea f. rosea IK726]|uniref:Uncharacterized protein n=3 Tax=Clonostachys rosea f. rosea IK726 TaxID=1349383 RepID=A0ACA9TG97_BIOOC|nr:unnamed protein product [Clonostachys rosea f. rosea IK726]CAG9949470.1 unnamed protein product [Clonostachys rosea f. rosea IK726]CAG9949474.1 unnamed protein product [Clonostachys rosea f. rosea IK726]